MTTGFQLPPDKRRSSQQLEDIDSGIFVTEAKGISQSCTELQL